MKRSTLTHLLAMVALGAATAIPAAAQNELESGPTIQVHLRTLKRDGGFGMKAYGDNAFVPGTPVRWFLAAGSSHPSDMTVCGGGVGEVGTLADKLSRNAFVWEVKMLPSKYENATATFDLEWARYQADGGERPAAEGKATLRLREGDRQMIDFVRSASGVHECQDDAAVIEVGTGYRENPQLAQNVLQYDLWLKHQQANGATVTRRFTAMGRQGSDVEFVFSPLRFAVPQLAPEQPAYDVVTSVQGTVRGRLLPNGRIALSVDTTRRDGMGPRDGGPVGGSGNNGRKLLDVGAGEAIEIELPTPGGSSSRPAVRAATPPTASVRGPRPELKEAVSLANGYIYVSHTLFFQGQRTSLLLQVTPARQ